MRSGSPYPASAEAEVEGGKTGTSIPTVTACPSSRADSRNLGGPSRVSREGARSIPLGTKAGRKTLERKKGLVSAL